MALDAAAFNHAVRVLRLQSGAALILFDGAGHACAALLEAIGKREARARIVEALPSAVEPPLNIVLAQGIARGEKMDYLPAKGGRAGSGGHATAADRARRR